MTNAETPSAYILFAARNPRDISIPVFEAMLNRLFKQVDDKAPEAFRGFYEVAHIAGQERLLAPFYKAVRQGFEHLRAGSPACAQKWGALFAGALDLIEDDATLTRDISDRLLGQVLPHAIRNKKSTPTDWQTASDILEAVGKVSAVAEKVDPRLPHDIIKWHLSQCGKDFIRAADKLTHLRKTPAFVPEIAAIENHAGIHVRAHVASVKTDPQQITASNRILVLQFDHAGDLVTARSLDPAHSRQEEISLEAGAKTPYRHLWLDMLLEESCDPLPGQDWVAPIAERAFTSLERR